MLTKVTVVYIKGLTVFCGKFCQIPWASSQNFAAHCGKIVQILRLMVAVRLCLN